MITTSVTTKNLIEVFTNASLTKDYHRIETLLDDKGEFEIQNKELEIVDSNKAAFLSWYIDKLEEHTITDFIYDQCIGCSFGEQIVLFNNGYFPKVQKDTSDRSKVGFRIDTKDNKICKIALCFVFLRTENKYIFECIGKIINDAVKTGSSMEEAVADFNANPAYDHFKFEPK